MTVDQQSPDAPHHDDRGDYLFTDHSDAGRAVRVVLAGELDIGTSDQLKAQLIEIVGRGQDVEIDMADLSFIDSTGLRAIVAAQSEVADGQRFEIVAASSQVFRVLEVTGLSSVLGPVAPSLSLPVSNPEYDAAVAALRDAEEANAVALAANESPPYGEGALKVLRRRIDAALDSATGT
jgi:anti-anti-sigma factor